jgi:hypothetical protein
MTRVIYALVALALVVVAVRGFKGQAQAEAKATVAEQRADSAYAYAMWVDARRQSDSIEYEKKRSTWNTERVELVARADRAAAERPNLVARIVEVAGDSAAVVEAVAELEVVHAEEVGGLRSALALSDSIIESQRQELATYSYVNGQLRAALEASRQEARLWEAASKKTLLGLRIPPGIAFGGGVVATAALFVVLR